MTMWFFYPAVAWFLLFFFSCFRSHAMKCFQQASWYWCFFMRFTFLFCYNTILSKFKRHPFIIYSSKALSLIFSPSGYWSFSCKRTWYSCCYWCCSKRPGHSWGSNCCSLSTTAFCRSRNIQWVSSIQCDV